MFAKNIYDKDLLSKYMKRVLQISKRKENPIEKCAKDLNKNFSYIAGGSIKCKLYFGILSGSISN